MMTPQERGRYNAMAVLVTLFVKRFGPEVRFPMSDMTAMIGSPEGFQQQVDDEKDEIVVLYDPNEGGR